MNRGQQHDTQASPNRNETRGAIQGYLIGIHPIGPRVNGFGPANFECRAWGPAARLAVGSRCPAQHRRYHRRAATDRVRRPAERHITSAVSRTGRKRPPLPPALHPAGVDMVHPPCSPTNTHDPVVSSAHASVARRRAKEMAPRGATCPRSDVWCWWDAPGCPNGICQQAG